MSETNIPASEAPNAARGAEIMARARRDQEFIARHLTNPRRVVVTGMGAVSPAGFGVDALWDRVMSGETAITALPGDMAEEYRVAVAGCIPGYDPIEAGFSKKEARRLAPFVQYAIIAADEAMEASGIDLEAEDLTRFACTFGSGIGGLHIFQEQSTVLAEQGARKVNPLFIPIMIENMAAGHLSIRYGLRGSCTSTVTACATGTHNIGDAFRLIQSGRADMVLAGGSEESIAPMALAGFMNLGAITKETDPRIASRPFDANRSGFVPGEGAGALVLEDLDHARARGARIVCEVTGFGSTGDAHHMTAPDPSGEGIARSMAQALAEGGFGIEDLGHLNAHGTSTHANDLTEATALCLLAGDRASEIPVMSVKGALGHMLGGTGAVEAVVMACALEHDVVPPTAGFCDADPACPVRVSNAPVTGYRQKVALSNSLGFGGHNATLALSPYVA